MQRLQLHENHPPGGNSRSAGCDVTGALSSSTWRSAGDEVAFDQGFSMPLNPLSAFPHPQALWIIISKKPWAPGQTQGGYQVCELLSPLPSSLPFNHSSGLGFKWAKPLYGRQQNARQTRSQPCAKNGWTDSLTQEHPMLIWLGKLLPWRDVHTRLPFLMQSQEQTKGQSQQKSTLRNQWLSCLLIKQR